MASRRLLGDLDRIDLNILNVLWKFGRITKAKMSQEVGLSAPRCWERMKQLERSGLIRSYNANLNLSKLTGISTFVASVKINNYSSGAAQAFEALCANSNNVLTCRRVLGEIDYMITVGAFGVYHYQSIMEAMMNAAGVSFDYTSYPVSKDVKRIHDVDLIRLIETEPAGAE